MPERRPDPDCREIFRLLGFDIDKMEDLRALRSNIEWVTSQREQNSKRSAAATAGIWSVASAILGTIVGFIANLLIGHGSPGH